jgi:hypothetical protein
MMRSTASSSSSRHVAETPCKRVGRRDLDRLLPAKFPEVLDRRRRARFGLGREPFHRALRGSAAGEFDMGRIGHRLARADVDVQELEMRRERPCRRQGGGEHGAVRLAAAGQDQDRLHGRAVAAGEGC